MFSVLQISHGDAASSCRSVHWLANVGCAWLANVANVGWVIIFRFGSSLFHVTLVLLGQWALRGMFFLWQWQKHRRTSPTEQAHFKLQLTSYLPTSHQTEQVIWPSPKAISSKIYFTFSGTRREISYHWTIISNNNNKWAINRLPIIFWMLLCARCCSKHFPCLEHFPYSFSNKHI